MGHLIDISLRIVAFVAGLVFLYLGVFAYERGHARFHNKLEDWWNTLKRSSDFEDSPVFHFVHGLVFTASLGRHWMMFAADDWIVPVLLSLGSSLFLCFVLLVPEVTGAGWSDPSILFRILASRQLQIAIPVAIIAPGMAAFVLMLFWNGFSSWISDGINAIRSGYHTFRTKGWREVLTAFAKRMKDRLPQRSSRIGLKGLVNASTNLAAFGMQLLGVFSIIFVFVFMLPLCAACLACFVLLGYAVLFMLEGATHRLSLRIEFAVVLVSQATAYVFFAGMERVYLLSWRRNWSFQRITLAIAGMCVVACVLFLGPLWFVSDGWALRVPTPDQLSSANAMSAGARYFSYANAVDVPLAFALPLATLLLFVHRPVWPPLRTSLMALQLAGVGVTRKRLYALGFVLLILSTGWVPGLIHEFWTNPQILQDIWDFLGKFKL